MPELTEGQKSVVTYMLRSDQHAAYGFELILKNKNPEDFFPLLDASGLLSAAFNPKPEPADTEGFFRVPYWPALGYLERIAKYSGETNNEEIGRRLMAFVREVGARPDGEAERVDNYHTNTSCAEIMGLVPSVCVSVADVALVKGWLDTRWDNSTVVHALDEKVFPSFLKNIAPDDSQKAAKLLEVATEIRDVADPSRPVRSRTTLADSYWLEQVLKHHARSLGAVVQAPAIDCLLEGTRKIFGRDVLAENSWVHRAAIEDHEQNSRWDYVSNAFVEGAREALDSWVATNPADASPYVTTMLDDPAQIVRRIAINAIRQRWEILGVRFQEILSIALFKPGHLHELYLLLQERYDSFTPEAKAAVAQAIEGLTAGKVPGTEEFERAQYQQRNWLDALRGHGDAALDAEYERLSAILGPLREHPDLLSYHTTWVGSGPSPYSTAELLSFAEKGVLADRVDGFVPNESERRSPREALISTVSEAVTESPSSFLPYLDPAAAMSRRLQYGIIEGYNRLIGKSGEPPKDLNRYIDVLLPFLRTLVGADAFWAEEVPESETLEPTKDWIPPVAVEVAKRLSANDEIPLSPANLDDILQIARHVLQHASGIEFSDDPMNDAINNPRGRAFDAMLQLLLRRCRDADKTSGDHTDTWVELQPLFDEELDSAAGARFEVSTLVGSYFAQLLYVSEDWLRARVNNIFPLEHGKNFASAISGLGYANSSKKVYEVLLSGDVPRKALALRDVKGGARERLIERVALAYMWGLESLNSPILEAMFEPSGWDDLLELMQTVSRWADEELSAEQVQWAMALAKRCATFALADLENRRQFLPVVARFISYTATPNENDMGWLLPVAPYAHESHGSYEFVEAIDKIATNDAQKAAAILEAYVSIKQPTYDFRDSLQSALRKIYNAGLHIEAVRILETIVRRGGFTNLASLFTELEERRRVQD